MHGVKMGLPAACDNTHCTAAAQGEKRFHHTLNEPPGFFKKGKINPVPFIPETLNLIRRKIRLWKKLPEPLPLAQEIFYKHLFRKVNSSTAEDLTVRTVIEVFSINEDTVIIKQNCPVLFLSHISTSPEQSPVPVFYYITPLRRSSSSFSRPSIIIFRTISAVCCTVRS